MDTFKNRYLTGASKFIFFQYMKTIIFLIYIKKLLLMEIGLKQFLLFISRLQLFYNAIKANKVVRVKGGYKFHIYFPAFPNRSFFVGLEKFLITHKDPVEINPTSVLISITKACPYRCKHCYQDLDQMNDLPLDKLKALAKQVQELNISYINIEGGEPLVKFNRLMAIMKSIDDRSEVWVNTTGFSLTKDMAKKMKESGIFGVMVSIHHWDGASHDEFVGYKGAFDIAISALKVFNDVGISTIINCTGTQDLVMSGGFDRIMDIARKSGCCMVQLIHEKPAGAWLGKDDTQDPIYLGRLYDLHLKYNGDRKYRDYPPVSSQAFESWETHFGCTAGGIERFYINANGDIQPCEFTNISIGNIMEEDFLTIYKNMRKEFKEPRLKWICCTEQKNIYLEMMRSKDHHTPLSKGDSKKIISKLDRGKKTPFYRKMRLYE